MTSRRLSYEFFSGRLVDLETQEVVPYDRMILTWHLEAEHDRNTTWTKSTDIVFPMEQPTQFVRLDVRKFARQLLTEDPPSESLLSQYCYHVRITVWAQLQENPGLVQVAFRRSHDYDSDISLSFFEVLLNPNRPLAQPELELVLRPFQSAEFEGQKRELMQRIRAVYPADRRLDPNFLGFIEAPNQFPKTIGGATTMPEAIQALVRDIEVHYAKLNLRTFLLGTDRRKSSSVIQTLPQDIVWMIAQNLVHV